jgi:flagellin-like hook-associated protein FlgL
MAMRINNNIAAINAQRSVGRNLIAVNRGMARLASGLRVNGASDDASGLVVSEGMRSELVRLGQNTFGTHSKAQTCCRWRRDRCSRSTISLGA